MIVHITCTIFFFIRTLCNNIVSVHCNHLQFYQTSSYSYSASANATSGGGGGGGDLLDLLDDAPAPAYSGASGMGSSAGPKKVMWVTAEQGKGIAIMGSMAKVNGQPCLLMDVANSTSAAVSALAVQLNKSTFGVSPVNPQITLSKPISNGG